MKALFTLKSAINHSTILGIIALVIIAPLAYPQIVMAAGLQTAGQDKSLVFEVINSDSLIKQNLTNTTNNSLTYDEAVLNDPYVSRLYNYLKQYNSPLADYAAQIVQQPEWQKALAISWVESNYCIHSIDNNCSGIGGAPGTPTWHTYATKLDWFIEMAQIMQRPIYKDKYTTFAQMRGVYVQPGSAAWVNGATAKYDELMALSADAEAEKLADSQLQISTSSQLATIAQ